MRLPAISSIQHGRSTAKASPRFDFPSGVAGSPIIRLRSCIVAIPDFIRNSIIAWVALLGCLLTVPCASAEDVPKRVLVLNPYSRDTAPFAPVVKPFRTTLAAETDFLIDFREIPLDLTHFGATNEEPLVQFLEQRLERQPVDLVVPIGGEAAAFAARNRDRLFSETPLLITGASSKMLPPGLVGDNATHVTQPLEPTEFIRQMLRMKPDTKHIAVILGSSEIERKWASLCRREFETYSDRVEFIWLDDLPVGEVLDRTSNLPQDSFIFHGMFIEDADGIPSGENELLKRLHEVPNAPVFSTMVSEIGLGIVGGQLYRNTDVGAEAGRIAARILNGESAGAIPPVILEPGTPIYDWRELRRWNIRMADLPADRIIRFREPGFWERYRWQAIAATSFLILQAVLIIALLINRSRRREAEQATTLIAEVSAKFVNLPPEEVDREIIDAMQRICTLLQIDLAVLWQWSTRSPASYTATHFFSLQDGSLPADLLSEDHFPWYKQELSAGKTVALRSLDELPDAAAIDKESCRNFEVRSSLTLPLSSRENTPIGILSFITTQKNRNWPQPLVDRLQLVASIFASTLARKRADEELLESELRLSLATEAADAGLWVLKIDTETFWANAKARQLFGYNPDEVITLQRFETSVHPQDWPRVRDAIAHSLSAGGNVDVEYRINTGDGSERWLVSRGRPFPASPDKPRRLIGLTMDISARRHMESEAKALRDDLAQVGRVTLLGNLASSLAHELSQPLGAILRNAEAAEIMLRDPSPDIPELQAIITDILYDDQRAGNVIDHLRSLLKRGTIDRVPVDLRSLIDSVIALVKTDAVTRLVKITTTVPDQLPMALGDGIHLQQVLLNLIVNAMDAMSDCDPENRNLHVHVHLADAGMIEIHVSDNGPGILDEYFDNLFAPFFTTKPTGMGMGLPVCKTIIEAHKGKIWAAKNPDGGTRFTFTVPAASQPHQP